jgi:hypothetical protein
MHVIQGSKLKLNLSASAILLHWLRTHPEFSQVSRFNSKSNRSRTHNVSMCSAWVLRHNLMSLVYDVKINRKCGCSCVACFWYSGWCMFNVIVQQVHLEMQVRVVLMIGLQYQTLGSVTGKFLLFQLLIGQCNMVYSWMAQEVFAAWSILGYCFILLPMPGGKMYKPLTMTFG